MISTAKPFKYKEKGSINLIEFGEAKIPKHLEGIRTFQYIIMMFKGFNNLLVYNKLVQVVIILTTIG